MKHSMSPTPGVRALAASIREVREAHGLTVRELAEALGFHPAMLSQWERTQRVPTFAQVALIVGYLQITGKQQEHMLELARTAREPNWLTPNTPDVGPELAGLLQCERTAFKISCWALNIVPGLLQTADYARAILSSGDLTLDQVDARLIVRLGRQEILTRKNAIAFSVIISERVLHEPVGSADTMSDQIDHLFEVSQLPNISLRILTPQPKFHFGQVGSFFIYEYEDASPIVLLEHAYASAFLHKDEQVTAYLQLAKMLAGKALSEEASRALIAEAMR